MKKLSFMNVKEQQLSREEMKNIMAGSGSGGSGDYCGDVYCDIGGDQVWSGYGCNPEDPDAVIINALNNCELEAGIRSAQSGSDVTCNGCAQFPA